MLVNRTGVALAFYGGVIAVLTLLSGTAGAGPIFFNGELKEGEFVPQKNVEGWCYTIRYSTISAKADGRRATIVVAETIEGPEQATKTVCLIPLPAGARAEGFVVKVGVAGQEPKAIKTARFLAAKESGKVYEAISRGLDSVKILALTGQPAILIPEFELQGKTQIHVQFEQSVRVDQGVLSIQCPMPATEWAHGPVSRLSLSVVIRSDQPLRSIFSPTHSAVIGRDGLNKATARVKADDWSGSDDFRLCWVADRDALGLRVVTHRAEGDKDGYFMLLGNPTGGHDKPIEKDVIFVMDASGSMRGEKIEQARAAVEYCVGQLNAGDRFNIITFGTDVESFRSEPVARSKDALAAAQEFIEGIVARGRTNINGALSKALAGKARQDRPRIMIFLTDGAPTEGELEPEKIVQSVKKANTSGTRIFIMGVGHDVNAHLLDKLAETTDGSSEYVAPQEEIDAKVATLYDRLSHPVLTDVAVSFGGLKTFSVYPKKLPALFKGSEVMVFGRYQEGGEHVFKISGKLHGKAVQYVRKVTAPKQPAGNATDFVAPLWAARNIGFLLQEIRLHGANDELLKEVIRLSKKFGIVTEYTVFLASDSFRFLPAGGIPGGIPRGASALALNEAKMRLAVANRQQSGQWAVNQARNDRRLQNKLVATREGNNYFDRRGRLVTFNNIRQIGARVYYLRDGQWVDSEGAGKRKTRKVKLYSDEYYKLLRGNADFARAQQLGWAVELNLGQERIVVEKDGKTKNEKLRQQKPKAPLQQNLNRLQNRNQRQNRRPAPGNLRNQLNAPNLQLPNLDLNRLRKGGKR